MEEVIGAMTYYEESLYMKWVASVDYAKMGNKTTVALVSLLNGFEVVGVSACVNPAMFDKEIGQRFALKDALSKLDELNGFLEQVKLYESEKQEA